VTVSCEGRDGYILFVGLGELAVSTGSACNSASAEPSYVLRALGRDTQLAQSSIRFSLGRYTTPDDVDTAIAAVNREVRRLRFLSPAWDDGFQTWPGQPSVLGEAGGRGQDAWIRIHLLVGGDVVKDARFQAYGCPHTLAVAAWVAGELPGRRRAALQPGLPADWAKAHGVPVEKLGRLLVVEDAVQACLRQWPQQA
jgi:cysteine desulfurase